MGKKINLAIAGVGNCASSLLQGLEYYQQRDLKESAGLVHSEVGGYGVADVQVVAAFDIDRRKVGRPLQEAVFAKPNCTTILIVGDARGQRCRGLDARGHGTRVSDMTICLTHSCD